MMSGHGADPVFFNKKDKDWTSRTLANPPTPFLPYTHPLPESGRHMCIIPYPT